MNKALTFFILLVGSGIFTPLHGQTRKDLKQRLKVIEEANAGALFDISTLKEDVINLQIELSKIRADNDSLKQQLANLTEKANSQTNGITGNVQKKGIIKTPGRCLGITHDGIPCTNKNLPGSDYCGIHKKVYEPNFLQNNFDTLNKRSNSSGENAGSGIKIQTGPKGGKFYINKKGKKVYIER